MGDILVTMAEITVMDMVRLIEGLRKLGLSGEEVTDFLCYIGTGDKKYEPKPIKILDKNKQRGKY